MLRAAELSTGRSATARAAVTVDAAKMPYPQFLMVEKQGAIVTLFFTNQEARVFILGRRNIVADGKRTRRRGFHQSRGRSIATKGFDPESRVFIFRHRLAIKLNTLDSGCCRSGSWAVATGVAIGAAVTGVAVGAQPAIRAILPPQSQRRNLRQHQRRHAGQRQTGDPKPLKRRIDK